MEEVLNKKDEAKIKSLPVWDRKNPSRKIPEKEEKHLKEMSVYEFVNTEEPGVLQEFSYGNTRNNMKFVLMHGGKYLLSRFVAQHINSRGTPIWDRRPNGMGQMEKTNAGSKPRFYLRESY